MATELEAREVKRRHSPQLLQQPGVCGVGVEKDEAGNYVIAIHLDTDDPQVRARLPQKLEGLAVRLVQSGPFHKLPLSTTVRS
jgi:hypothetical protein